jgi:murein DD-endopeptidase / murein LD-carboxypeptidase
MQVVDVVERAQSLIGVPFRVHGRSPKIGLDCVGLVVAATGTRHPVPTGYTLRNADEARWRAILDQHGARRTEPPLYGDVLLLRAGPAQFHLGIWTGESLIHADARLRRVVELPGKPPWSVLGAWQFWKE